MNGWNDPSAPAYYEAFCRTYSRYEHANRALISHARLRPGMQVLDLGAGTGRTAEMALARLGPEDRVLCVEPSRPMRLEGVRRLKDSRVEWRARLPKSNSSFDRILCGAAIWQLDSLPEIVHNLARLLRSGGALCFNIPALYLLEPDEPGGGNDPFLIELPARLMMPVLAARRATPSQVREPLDQGQVTACLTASGLRPNPPWTFRSRLTQEAYAAWLKIPAVAGPALAQLPARERARRIDNALDSVDRSSWKWERWKGWTAWKP